MAPALSARRALSIEACKAINPRYKKSRINSDGQFVASEVLAKHDENYMPPEAKHALEQAQKNGNK
jgi:hypothetical protein